MIDNKLATIPSKELFNFTMWIDDNMPRVGDWFYAPIESGLTSYTIPCRIDAIQPDNRYTHGLTVCPGKAANGLGIEEYNLRSFKWYRPSKKLTLIVWNTTNDKL